MNAALMAGNVVANDAVDQKPIRGANANAMTPQQQAFALAIALQANNGNNNGFPNAPLPYWAGSPLANTFVSSLSQNPFQNHVNLKQEPTPGLENVNNDDGSSSSVSNNVLSPLSKDKYKLKELSDDESQVNVKRPKIDTKIEL